jgi:hypothetical protein
MIVSSLFVLLVLSTGVFADGNEVTLTGKIMCARCELKETPKCQNAIRVTDGGKTVTYYFLDKGAAEDYHEAICGNGQKAGKVTGVVSEKNGKKWITPKKVEYAAQ